jgi:hypothetical protein
MKRIVAICLAGAALAACGNEPMGPPVPPPPSPPPNAPPYAPPPGADNFRESDFTWSQGTGKSAIIGVMSYGGGPASYTCGDVVLLPETPWSADRTLALYLSGTETAVPASDVRARTPKDPTDQAHAATYSRYARHAACNATNHFSFAGLPNGAWYIVTLAKPTAGGAPMAVMRRVATYGFPFKTVLH